MRGNGTNFKGSFYNAEFDTNGTYLDHSERPQPDRPPCVLEGLGAPASLALKHSLPPSLPRLRVGEGRAVRASA